MDEKKGTFSYTYSASQQKEIISIREKYAPPPQEEDKLEQLRRLDRSVTRKGAAKALTVGTVGALLLGIGMCCCLVWTNLFVLGIIAGVLGIAAASAAYPLYNYVTKKERERIAPEIIRLTDELMK